MLITTPFWLVYVDKEMLGEAENLKLILTAGVGSNHIDLGEAAERNITVAEITGSNTVSVAEHAVMQVLALVRNFVPACKDVVDGGWSIGEIAAGSHDLEKKTVGIYSAGEIGPLIAARLKPFDVETLYYKRSRLGTTEESYLGIRYATLDEMLGECDVIVIASPLTPETRGLFDRETLFGMKRGAHLVKAERPPRQHRPRGHRRDVGARGSAGGGASRRLRRRRLGPAAGPLRPPLARDAEPRHDPARLRHHAGGPGALCRRRA